LQLLSGQDIKRLDTHIHLYNTNRPGSFDFLDDHAAAGSDKLRSPHLAQQFAKNANPAGVQFAYVVEASTRREDNFWLAEICNISNCLLACNVALILSLSTILLEKPFRIVEYQMKNLTNRNWQL
jgi:predicted TIM-barrel fold metal-dependent hydrolase